LIFSNNLNNNSISQIIEIARNLFKERMHSQAIEKMKEVIYLATIKKHIQAIASAFLICGLIDFYFKDYLSAFEYFIELVYNI